ncbi:MAG: TIGR03915 family putative DNA repair protein [Clostridia bacterium]|nr:TIGR03915 family putative DNA repair protein [Clostridia bacterium]
MTALLYDGTYGGFLTGVFEAYRRGLVADCIIRSRSRGLPLCDCVFVETSDEYSQRVERKLFELDTARTVYKAWLTEEEGIEDDIFDCIRMAVSKNSSPWNDKTKKCVKRVCDAAGRVGFEVHRFQQFVRFSRVSADPEVFVADIDPLYDVLPMLGNHFSKRFSSQYFIIRDVKRQKALVWDMRQWYISYDSRIFDIPCVEDGGFGEMWKGYFNAVAIPWRKNKKLQAQFVPQRYRRYLTEFN